MHKGDLIDWLRSSGTDDDQVWFTRVEVFPGEDGEEDQVSMPKEDLEIYAMWRLRDDLPASDVGMLVMMRRKPKTDAPSSEVDTSATDS